MESCRKRAKLNILRTFAAVMILLQCLTAVCSYAGTSGSTESEDTDWLNHPSRVIAHGGGEIDGIELTNSLEAVMASIEKGCTLIELDMLLTSDEEIVMIHDFGRGWTRKYFGEPFAERPTKEEFLSLKIKGKYTPMSFDMLTEILDKHPEVKIITDCKETNFDLLFKLSREYPDYVDRIIPQIYYSHQYDEIRKLGFKNIIFTLYSMGWMEYYEVSAFIDENDLFAVTVGVDYKYDEIAYRLAKKDVTVYMHPVNDYEQALSLMDKRIYGVYSSTLTPAEFETEEARERINDWVILKEEIYATCI